jgi:hypothetical protein
MAAKQANRVGRRIVTVDEPAVVGVPESNAARRERETGRQRAVVTANV